MQDYRRDIELINSLRLRKNDHWIMERRSIDAPTVDGQTLRIDCLLCISANNDNIIGMSVIEPDVSREATEEWAINCILNPENDKPHRPCEVTIHGGQIDFLKELFEVLGITVILDKNPCDLVSDILALMHAQLAALAPISMLSNPDTDPDLIASFFHVAADYYRLKPWKLFAVDVPILILLDETEYCAMIMGTGGETYGLVLYDSLEDMDGLYSCGSEEEILELARETWSLGFSYDSLNDLPEEAQKEVKMHRLELVNKHAYPGITVVDPEHANIVRPPDDDDIYDLTLATRAITDAIANNKTAIKKQAGLIHEVFNISLLDEDNNVEVFIPHPELFSDSSDFDNDEDNALPIVKQSMTKERERALRAAEIVDEANFEPGRNKRIKLAREALAVSPDCPDAYILLACDSAKDDKERLFFLTQAVEAGERLIDKEIFDKYQGQFWGIIETRPYMRARMELALLRYDLKDFDQAISDFQDILRLNENDNMGARYYLWSLMFQTKRFNELQKSMNKYKDEDTACWQYSRALLSFCLHGFSKQSNKYLSEAIKQNKYVLEYLLGKAKMPIYTPEGYQLGSRDEAIIYADVFADAWKEMNGALDWLRNQTGDD